MIFGFSFHRSLFFFWGGKWDIKDFKSRKMYHVGENFLKKEFSWRWTFRWISLVHFTVLIWILEVVSI